MQQTNSDIIEIVKAVHDYQSQVYQKDPSGWWDGSISNSNLRGWFPSNFVEKIATPDSTFTESSELKKAESDGTLPRFWGKKVTKEGQIYYYNSATNQTTYDLETVFRNGEVCENLTQTIPVKRQESSGTTWIPGPQSLIDKNEDLSWELLINNILKAISDLNQAAKQDSKPLYITGTNQIVISIRDMLASSGCISRENVVLKENKVLRSHHNQIMASLSKLVLTSKVASGVWPPPDAVNKMRYQAGQCLLAIRHFVSIAQDIPLSLTPIEDCKGIDDFDIKGAQLSDIEFVSRLDTHTGQIIGMVSELLHILRELKKKAHSFTEEIQKSNLMEKAKEVVTEVGQFLSLVEDLKISDTKQLAKLMNEFNQRKELLYTTINDLVTKAQSCVDPYAPANVLDKLYEVTFLVEKCVQDLSTTVKQIVDQHELLELGLLAVNVDNLDPSSGIRSSVGDTELGQLQRRAMSLTLNKIDSSSDISVITTLPTNSVDEKGSSNSLNNSRSRGVLSMPPLAKQSGPTINSKLSKLEKLTGENLGTNDLGRQPNENSWMKYDYGPDEISFNMEGQVNGGTIAALVERLTLHDQPIDNGYLTAFLMMYRQFMTTEELIDQLLNRFFLKPPTNDPAELKLWMDKKQTPIRLRVYNALKSLLETYWHSAETHLLHKLASLAQTSMNAAMPTIAHRLNEVLNRKLASPQAISDKKLKKQTSYNIEDCPASILPRNLNNILSKDASSFILEVDALELARQLTILESRIFCEIVIPELLNQDWTSNSKSSNSSVKKSCRISTQLTGWFVAIILGEQDLKKRANLVKQIIKIGDKCLSLNNFSSLMSIVSALNSSSVNRLKKTFENVTAKTRATLEALRKSTDLSRNYAVYRQTLKQCSPPCLPFLGLFLTDLTFTEEGNPNIRGSGLINFDKYYKASRIIVELQRFQIPYSLLPVSEIQDYLARQLEATDTTADMYQRSLMIEPREGSAFGQSTSVLSMPEQVAGSASSFDQSTLKNVESRLNQLEKVGFL